jgi:Sulfotransferase family
VELRLDPDRLPRPVPPPGPRDFIICGCPRTGTSLLSALIHQPPACLTVMEPWDGMRLPAAELFASLRQEIEQTGHLGRGKLDLGAMSADGEVRWRAEGAVQTAVTTTPDYRLGVKWPAFWRYLELLPATKFLVCLRNPLEVIASFKRVGGRLARGLEYDIAFHREMNAELSRVRNIALRRVRLFDYVHERILPHFARPEVLSVRYERWFTEPTEVLAEISDFLETDLTNAKVAIRPPVSKDWLDDGEHDLVRRHCQTAPALGYSI